MGFWGSSFFWGGGFLQSSILEVQTTSLKWTESDIFNHFPYVKNCKQLESSD